MAKLPVIKRFLTEDFISQSSWIGQFFYQLNLVLNLFTSALKNDITLADNMRTQIATLPVVGSAPVVSFPYKFSPASPVGISIINVAQSNSPAVVLTAAVDCAWEFVAGRVSATVRGLDSGSTYNVTFLVWGG